MKNKKYCSFLFFEGLILIILLNTFGFKEGNLFDLLALPFTALADFLGKLSLSSKTGNAVAIMIYGAFCLVPVFVLIFKTAKKTFQKADSLLILLSAVLFAVIYLMINPSEMGMLGEIENEGEILTGCIWSVLLGYLILQFLTFLENSKDVKIEKYLKALAMSVGAVLVISVCAGSFGTLAVDLKNAEGFITKLIAFMSFLNKAIPDVFGIAIVICSLNVLGNMSEDRYSDETVRESEKLSSLCMFALKVSVIISVIFNILQLRYIAKLQNISFNAEIPLVSLGFILAVLILSRYIKDSKALKEDNDSFI